MRKIIHVLMLTSENPELLIKLVKSASHIKEVNWLYYNIEESKYRMLLAALKEGSSSSYEVSQTFYIDPFTQNLIKEKAKKHNISPEDLIKEAISKYQIS